MRILLVSPSPLNSGEWAIPYKDLGENFPPLSILTLKKFIEQDHEARILVYDYKTNDVPQILKEASKSDVVGFSLCSYFQYAATREIIQRFKQEEIDSRVVLGGAFSIYHSKFLCDDGIDIVVNGEGEIAFSNLLEALETGKNLKEVQGLTYKQDHDVIDTGEAPFLDLNEVPLPVYDELPLATADYKHIPCETSRGCWNHCSFCGIYPHRKWRAYSPEKAVAAIKHAYRYFQYSRAPYIFLTDSNFVADINRVKKIACLMDEKIPTYCCTRLDHIDEDTVTYLQKIGFKAVFVGVESASQETLNSVNKNLSVDIVEKKCRLLIRHNILPRLSFIIGLPGESRDNVINTLKYMNHMVELFGEDMNLVVFPCRLDTAHTPAEFELYKFIKTIPKTLVSEHDQKFGMWVLSLVYLINTYHNTLSIEEQTAKVDELIRYSPEAAVELAKKYDGPMRSWLQGFRRYFQSNSE